jgi:hypothetical protein
MLRPCLAGQNGQWKRERHMKRSSAWILGLGLVAAAPAASIFTGPGAAHWLGGWVSAAKAAEDVSFDGLSFKIGVATITIPHIAINGASLSKGDVQALVNGPWSLATADALAKFDATSVVIPEVHLDMTVAAPNANAPAANGNAVYRDIHLDGIKSGKASRVSSAGMTEQISGPAPVSLTMGAFLATDYDLAGAVRFIFAAAAPGEAPKPITGPASIDGMQIKAPQGVEVTVGKLAMGAIKMRPLATPVASVVQSVMAASAAAPGKDLPPAEAAKMIAMLADFYDAFAVDGMSVSDISVKVPDPKFQGFLLKTLKFGPIANSRFAEMGLEGMELNAEGGHIKLGRIALLGIDLKPFLSTLAAAAKKGDVGPAAMAGLDWRAAIPHLDGIVVKGVDLLVPTPTLKSFTLAGYELKLANYVGGIPTSLRTQLDDLVADSSVFGELAGQLAALGYKNIDLSSIIDLIWNENSKSVRINEVSAKGASMGLVSLKGALGNVPRELFAGSTAQMQVAGLGVTLSELSLRIENAGLVDKLLGMIAQSQGAPLDQFRGQLGMQAQVMIPQLLGGSDKAKAVANAVASFIAKPKSLSISVKAKGGGLGITDLMAGGSPNPAEIFGKLDVTASAND